MNVLLTGSSGYIGSALTAELRRLGHVVTGLDRRDPHYGVTADRFIRADLLDDGALDGAFRDVDLIAHLAAAKDDWGLSDDEYYRDNLAATERLIDAGRAAGMKRWLFYSTVGVMGSSEVALDESAPYAPTIAYGASKMEAEKRFQAFSDEDHDAEIMVIRPSAVYGPGNPDNTNVYRLIDAIRGGKFLMVGDGLPTKTTSFLGNLIPATLFLLERMRPGLQTYIYVDDPVMTTNDLVDTIYGELGRKRPSFRLPLPVAKTIASVSDVVASVTGVDLPITAARIEKFCTSTVFDGGSIRRAGFRQPVANAEALSQTVAWHINGRER